MFSRWVIKVQTRDRDRGAILVEYAFLFALIVLAAMVGVAVFGASVLDLFSDSSDRYTEAVQN